MLMLITFTSGRLSASQFREETIWSLESNALLRSSIFTITSLAPGAIPMGAIVPLDAMIPETFVPWPA